MEDNSIDLHHLLETLRTNLLSYDAILSQTSSQQKRPQLGYNPLTDKQPTRGTFSIMMQSSRRRVANNSAIDVDNKGAEMAL